MELSVDTHRQPLLDRLGHLLRIVRCPATGTAVTLVGRDELLTLLPETERARVSETTVAAFVSRAAGLAYPVLGRIVSFLDRDRLHMQPRPDGPQQDDEAERVKREVRDWYDRFGWVRSESGLYHDTAMFSQAEMQGHGFYETSSHLGFLDRLHGGEFVLDAASGAIAHPETLAYSWQHRFRICVDMSTTALLEADAKIGDAGFCCLADISICRSRMAA